MKDHFLVVKREEGALPLEYKTVLYRCSHFSRRGESIHYSIGAINSITTNARQKECQHYITVSSLIVASITFSLFL